MKAAVIDASLMFAYLWEEGDASLPQADALVVPPIFGLELANAALMGVRRGRLGSEDARFGVEVAMSVVAEAAGSAPEIVLELAHRTGLTTYDASYLAHAMAAGIPLASLDTRLRQAAVDEGVTVLP